MVDRTMPLGTIMSSLDSVEGGLLILDQEGCITHANDWLLSHCQYDRDGIIGKSFVQIFADASPALTQALEQAHENRLSRMLSHKLHRNLLPLYAQNHFGEEKLAISVLVTPLSSEDGVLIRIIDYTGLVKRENQIRFNEKLLRLEKDFLSRAPDLSESFAEYVEALTSKVNRLPHPFYIQTAVLVNEHFVRFLNPNHPIPHKAVESIILSRTTEQAIEEVHSLKDASGAHFHPLLLMHKGKVVGYAAFISEQDTKLNHIAHKNRLRIVDLINNLIEWKANFEQLHFLANNDVLTGLLNRGALNSEFQQAAHQCDAFALLGLSI